MALEISLDNQLFLIPEGDDPCALWVGYFTKLKKEVGRDNATTIWLITWKKKGAVSCLTNPKFNNWLEKNNLNVSNLATRTFSDVSEIGGNFLGMGKNITKVIAIGVPVLLGALILGLVVLVKNTSKNATITGLAMLTPTGRGLKLLGK